MLEAASDGRALSGVSPWRGDPDPGPILGNVASAQHHAARVRRPAVRRGWLDNGPGGSGRGDGPFVEVSWDEALDLVAAELRRVYDTHGPESVYGGSYGWASAGRFHHAPSQLHRFLNTLGGYVGYLGDYSYGASGALLPHVVGDASDLMARATAWDVVAEHTELFLAFGGISEKNSVVSPGGVSKHGGRAAIRAAVARGCRVADIAPLADDTFPEAAAEWLPIRPASDAAVMLALAFVLDQEDLVDHGFLASHTVGYERFARYVRGDVDGVPKTPEWAARLSDLPAGRLRRLAREMADSRTMINVSWSMQRQHHGEQPVWLAVTLASMLGQIGLPGGGFQHGYGSSAAIGQPRRVTSAPALPPGRAHDVTRIPVARIADMMLDPGREIDYDGRRIILPRVEFVYWCGGNPFHHHQNLARLRRAFTKPATVVVHEQFWTSTARHADVVLPATMSIERDDYGAGRNDALFFPMPALTEPAGQARDDHTIFARLAARLGVEQEFTEGRDVAGWLRHLYDRWRTRLNQDGHYVPDFDAFWHGGPFEIPVADERQVLLSEFRADPDSHPLPTPSGRIEIHSDMIDGFGYIDCPGHPVWLEPEEWLGSPDSHEHPLHLIANQPRLRLHSQLDIGDASRSGKIHGREPLRMHASDAARRGLADGDVVLVFNDRGRLLAGLSISAAVRPGVVQLSTGAWYDPDPADPTFCRHGNPNVLTADRPSSRLSQATTAQHALVEVTRWNAPVPELTVSAPPPFEV